MSMAHAEAITRKTATPIILQAFAETSFRSLFANRPVETLEANQLLFCEGDQADCVFEILKGTLRLYKLMSDGRRAITGFLFPGEVVGVAFKDRYLYSAEAVTTVRLQRYQRSQLHSMLARTPALGRELLSMACDELSAAQDQMLLLARKSASERIASFLISVARRLSPTGEPVSEFDLPMSRLDIADYLGLTIETVSRIMTKLKSEGRIALPSPHHVVLKRPSDLLAASGDEEPGEPHMGPRIRAVQGASWPH